MTPRRLLPGRPLPAYAYLPGRHPHPVRDPGGHSHGLPEVHNDPEALLWGIDLFDQGYPWEAHEAWEPLWFAAERGSALRALYKGLILLAAAAVKVREGKAAPALRHAERAVALLRDVIGDAAEVFRATVRRSPAEMAEAIEVFYCAPLRAVGSTGPELVIHAG